MRLKFTQSTRKQRIAKGHALYVINNFEPTISINDRGETEYQWIAPDDRGVEIEIVGAIIERDLLLVFHVMPTSYRKK